MRRPGPSQHRVVAHGDKRRKEEGPTQPAGAKVRQRAPSTHGRAGARDLWTSPENAATERALANRMICGSSPSKGVFETEWKFD